MPAMSDCRNCPGATHDLLACLTREQRSRLTNAAVPHAYRRHECIFHEETPALALYCVRAGTLKLFRRLSDGEEVVLGVRGPGDWVGLWDVLAGIPYATTATTLDPTVVCAVPREIFLDLVGENSKLGYRLLTRLALEARLMQEQLVERNHSRVRKRTARFLVQQFQGEATAISNVHGGISMQREEMAQLIGTTAETLSRTLHGLAGDGIVRLDRKEIRLLDLPALLKLAE